MISTTFKKPTSRSIWSISRSLTLWFGVMATMTATTASGHANDFELLAAPFLSKFCVACHNSIDPQGELDLSNAEGWKAGGTSGEVSQSPWSASLIWERISSQEMPPESATSRPSAEEVEQFRRWLQGGASWSKGRVVSEYDFSSEMRAGRDWWSFQPLNVEPSPNSNSQWSRHHFDAWLAEELAANRLAGSPVASKTVLIRRLYFDLLGLPPSPEVIEEFVSDDRVDAYERLLDRLLASPRYGEHWARHWLDIARFGDTHGYERDFPRENAWPYRDYVIQSLNQDQSYDEFVRWQIAGDVVAPQLASARVATSFLACGPYDVTGLEETKSPVLRRMARADELDDILTTTLAATLGITINCARCHNHKFDPVSQADYYRMAALLGGIRRDDRPIESVKQQENRERQLESLKLQLTALQSRLSQLKQEVDLADLVGGGTGQASRREPLGLDPRTGVHTHGRVAMLDEVKVNQYTRTASRFIDGVAIPDGGEADTGQIIINSRGDQVRVPDTSGQSWDYFQNGPVNSQAFTILGEVDYADESHSMLGMHANKLITFDLEAIRRFHTLENMDFSGIVGYGGRVETASADIQIWIDDQLAYERKALKRSDGAVPFELAVDQGARFLTLIATEGQGGISHDQVFWGDAKLTRPFSVEQVERQKEIDQLLEQRETLVLRLNELTDPDQIFGITEIEPQTAYVHLRGNPEEKGPTVLPQTLSTLNPVQLPASASDGERRLALAEWITAENNALFARVIANRIWHYHFGSGLVDTPSDFGFYGGRPSHPRLLDALATDLKRHDWSLKHLHRAILSTAAFTQSSRSSREAMDVDFENRLHWRFQPKRLSAEAIRDAVLTVAGTLNHHMGGPGFRDFEVEQRYAPIYRYTDLPDSTTWRRSIYRFSVRSVPHPFMDVLDCPNPSTASPKRNQTTTALQSLAMFNDSFTLDQARYFSIRLQAMGQDETELIRHAFLYAFGREPTAEEEARAMEVIQRHGLEPLCRALINANEFIYVD